MREIPKRERLTETISVAVTPSEKALYRKVMDAAKEVSDPRAVAEELRKAYMRRLIALDAGLEEMEDAG